MASSLRPSWASRAHATRACLLADRKTGLSSSFVGTRSSEGWCLVGACDLDLTFQLDAVVGEPRLDDLDRVVDVAACMLLLGGGDVVHEEVL